MNAGGLEVAEIEGAEWKVCNGKRLWNERTGEERLDTEARCEINKFMQAAAVATVLTASLPRPSSLHSLSLSSILFSSNQQVPSVWMFSKLQEKHLIIKSLLTLFCCNASIQRQAPL